MSGIGFSELVILFLIGLIVLGPERLPRVAKQIGHWIGEARRMTRMMRRQLEDELDLDKNLSIQPASLNTPRDDDTYSPLHEKAAPDVTAGLDISAGGESEHPETATGEADVSDEKAGEQRET